MPIPRRLVAGMAKTQKNGVAGNAHERAFQKVRLSIHRVTEMATSRANPRFLTRAIEKF